VKNQYLGDINDYRKYGLLRVLARETGLRTLVAWMLTPDDGPSDGRRTGYLEDPAAWRRWDDELFDTLHRLVVDEHQRDVAQLERSGVLPHARFFSDPVPVRRPDRREWFSRLLAAASGCGLVFLDPDNGIEVPSAPPGTQGSPKYVYWRELTRLYDRGHSMLVYQHFPRENHDRFVGQRSNQLIEQLDTDLILAIKTSRVIFLLAPQPDHQSALLRAVESFALAWQGQIRVTEVSRRGESRRRPPPAIASPPATPSTPHRSPPPDADGPPGAPAQPASSAPTTAERASQAWQILVLAAFNHRVITYGKLARLMGIGASRGIGVYLNPIKNLCAARGLPPLHVLAVSKRTGRPGSGLRVEDFDAERRRVFDFDWSSLAPPTPDELGAASSK